jgi:hypothetical protein
MEALWSPHALRHMTELKAPEDLVHLEERFAYLMKAERADLAMLRSRPYVQFRNAVIAHLQKPGSTTLGEMMVIKFRLAGLELKIVDIGDSVTVWTGISEPELVDGDA